jgi:hypothetical protein
LILLENYAKAFQRDMPLETQANIRVQQRKFDLRYKCLPRERLLDHLESLMESDADPRLFASVYLEALDDMNA